MLGTNQAGQIHYVKQSENMTAVMSITLISLGMDSLTSKDTKWHPMLIQSETTKWSFFFLCSLTWGPHG